MTTERSCELTIFEGPDGGGKSTVARAYAESTGAHYVHLGPFKQLREQANLARFYAEAMMPAILGHRPVVLDRSWLSEPIYGLTYRHGLNRVGYPQSRMLERLAWRCNASVVVCRPAFDTCLRNWAGRREAELLDDEAQLRQVWDLYGSMRTSLRLYAYNYEDPYEQEPLFDLLGKRRCRVPRHSVAQATAGNLDAPVLLVGESFTDHGVHDPLYQWPFASFGVPGCSAWLTEFLAGAGIGEQYLLWANADMDLRAVLDQACRKPRVIALGQRAHSALSHLNVDHFHVDHPQYHKRFKHREAYPLIPTILEALK